MCEWGNDVIVGVTVPADLSHSGNAYTRGIGVDACIADIVVALEKAGIHMRGSCCGHGKRDGEIHLQDGRTLLVTAALRSGKLEVTQEEWDAVKHWSEPREWPSTMRAALRSLLSRLSPPTSKG